jgi:hypothetical protein
VEACPPDLLVRAAVLTPSEPILSHIAGCLHCTNIYHGALGREWLPKRRGSEAHSKTSSSPHVHWPTAAEVNVRQPPESRLGRRSDEAVRVAD